MSRSEIQRLLEDGDVFVLTTHLGADGDGFGSQVALARHLRDAGKTVHIINPDAYDSRLGFLLRAGEAVETWDGSKHAKLLAEASAVLLVDVNTWSRLGSMASSIRDAAQRIGCIDHHLPGTDAFDVSWIDESACATGQMVFDLFEEAGWAMTGAIAEALYVALLTDTGSFRFARTSPRVHRIAARLLELGVHPQEVYEHLYEHMPLHQAQLTGDILSTMESAGGGRVIWQKVTREMLRKRGADMDDTAEVVNYTIAIHGVEVGILFKELEPGVTKASLRSKGTLDVNEFARTLGGGGHRHAAGIVLQEDFDDACARIVTAVCRALEELPVK